MAPTTGRFSRSSASRPPFPWCSAPCSLPCWTNLVAAELLAADSGLGFLITMGGRLGRPDIIVLGMICVGLSGAVIGFIIDQIEKKLLAGIRR